MDLPGLGSVRSSVLYLFWVILSHFWNVACTIALLAVFVPKSIAFPMASWELSLNIASPLVWFALNLLKLACGRRGNRSEHAALMAAASVLGVCCILIEVYFIVWQPFLLRKELPLHCVSLVVDGVFVISSVVMVVLIATK